MVDALARSPFAKGRRMKLPLEIVFRNVNRTPEVEDRIRMKAGKLDRMFDRITGCRVVVESPHKKQAKGHTYHVTVEVQVPSETIVVNRDPQNHDHEELGIALRDAFAAAQRRLRSYSRKRNASTSHSGMRISEVLAT
jgi:ribosome-associated translation inhibitor RaiA